MLFLDASAEEKNRIEELQRSARKDRKKTKDEFSPLSVLYFSWISIICASIGIIFDSKNDRDQIWHPKLGIEIIAKRWEIEHMFLFKGLVVGRLPVVLTFELQTFSRPIPRVAFQYRISALLVEKGKIDNEYLCLRPYHARHAKSVVFVCWEICSVHWQPIMTDSSGVFLSNLG